MKKLLIWAMVLMGILLSACSNSDDEEEKKEESGSIYGIVTERDSAEPLKGIGIQLLDGWSNVLMTTQTFEDGSYEFMNLKPGFYYLGIVSNKYYPGDIKTSVSLESGRQAKIDLPLYKAWGY